MNEISKNTQNHKMKNGQKFNYRRRNNIRVLHKNTPQTVNKSANQPKQNYQHNKNQTGKKTSRGSYQ